MHEAHMNDDENVFITLTYSDKNLPEHSTLVKEHFQKFIKSLRQKTKRKIRFYMCGEYGEEEDRPHYHALLFGYKFPDAYLYKIRNGHRIYRSLLLEATWTHGFSEIGSVTFQSAGYVARYIMKKQNGDRAETHYAIVDEKTGEYFGKRLPEYTNMSLKPGIGYSYYQKYKTDFYDDIALTPDAREMPVPEYYRRIMAKEEPERYEILRKKRVAKSEHNPDNAPHRLEARERCQQKKLDRLKREL